MKLIITFIVISALGCISNLSKIKYQNAKSNIYQSAYLFISKNEKGKSILVFDSLVYIPRINFAKHLKKFDESNNQAFGRLDSLDLLNMHKSNEYFEFDYEKPKRASFILYFSNIDEDGYFLAEIMKINSRRNLKYFEQIKFNEATQYLFFMDKNGNLKNVDKVNLFYD